MTRFQVITEKVEGNVVYVLRDMQSGAVAKIAPSQGANCLELRLAPGEQGKPVPVINDMQFLSKLHEQPSRYGIPILFPWASGIPAGEFAFGGKTWHLNKPGNTSSRHHGYVNTAAWKVVRSDCDNNSAWLTCSIDSANCGEIATKYPSSFTLELTWRLSHDGFKIEMEARNTGASAMPMGAGLHPYFTIPFGESGSRQTCRLWSDVGRMWDLDQIVDGKPGGENPGRVYLDKPTFNAAAPGGSPLNDTKFNHVFEGKLDASGHSAAAVIDPANKLKLVVSGSKDFNTWVFYTPPDRSAIALEPWTMTPNAFNLAAVGVKDTGMLTLDPGEKWSGAVNIKLEKTA